MPTPFKTPAHSHESQLKALSHELSYDGIEKIIGKYFAFKDIGISLPFSLETESYKAAFESLDEVSPQFFSMACAETGKQLCSCRLVIDLGYEIEKYEFSNGISVILKGGVDAIHLMWAMASIANHPGDKLKMIGAHNPVNSARGSGGKIDSDFAFYLAFAYPDIFDYSTIADYDAKMHREPRGNRRCERPCYCGIGGFCGHVPGQGPTCDIRKNKCNGGCCGA